ncbi:MAG TPA: MoxR family ATPase [Candidatus Acidoferrales bacterium]|nr:MoxR family ATPase [Candidatus Acidoferrales bacterium]
MTSSLGTEGQTGGLPATAGQPAAVVQQADFLAEKMGEVRREISKAIVGQTDVVDGVLIALLAGGHVLLEGAPGLGKTMLVRTLAQAVALKYSRIQFTPDLMPADVIGTSVVQENGDGRKSLGFQPGPIFTNLLLADEINRATPKTQSALLEAMQEKQVTVAHTSHLLEEPFFVMATQNPLEMEGTYPLPEAQLDRFLFKLRVPYPGREDLHDILNRTTQSAVVEVRPVVNGAQILELRKIVRTVPVAPHVQEYVVKLTLATHPERQENLLASKYIRYGSSPRGAQTLILGGKVRALLDGRYNVSLEDVRALLLPALRHRIILNFEAQADSRTPDDLLEEIAGKISLN